MSPSSTDVQPQPRPSRPGDQIAVVSQSGPTVTFFDARTHERLSVLELPPEPHELCFDPARGLLYCTSTYRSGYYHQNSGRAHEVSVIDVAAHRLVDVLDLAPEHGPHGLALDQRRRLLYVSVEGRPGVSGARGVSGGVLVLDTETHKTVARIATGAPGPHWFALTPDGRRGFATNKEAGFVTVLDLEEGEEAGRIEVPGSEGLAVSPEGHRLYVAAPKADFSGAPAAGPNGVRVIDIASGRIERVLGTRGPVIPVHTTSNGLILAGELGTAGGPGSDLGAQADGVLHVYAPETCEPLARVPVGRTPLTIHSAPAGDEAYVSNVASGEVTVVSLETFEKTGELHVERAGEPGAHGLAYLPGTEAAHSTAPTD